MASDEVGFTINTAQICYLVCQAFKFMSNYAKNTKSIEMLTFSKVKILKPSGHSS